MRVVVLGAGLLLAGCVQEAYVPPPPIELQSYPPPVTYRTSPYRPPMPAPLAEPLPAPVPLTEPPAATNAAPSDDSGAIPLQQMPAPAPDSPASTQSDPSVTPMPTASAPVMPRTPTAGPGSNVPLEGFRPMHGQTRPAP